MSALSAPALLGDVATTAGGAGAAGRRADLVVFRAGFFAGRFRADEVCFFRVVWEVESIGATASAASSITAKALCFRNIIGTTIAGCRPDVCG
jgi:hypothetical protein